ncbi:MAG: hypothetical protein IT269_09630 [Saprospiraceae bacterium]|nr:hypothetical protein [Saprospiraceae bacterium]
MKQTAQIEHQLHNLASPKRWGNTFWGLLATLAVAAGIIWWLHGAWLAKPNQVMLGAGLDGLKNYFTAVWHIQRDEGYAHYEGMNYPYGEHVLFTDNQPLLCSSIMWWSRHVKDVRGEAVGIINSFQAISLLLGVFFMFLLFRKLHMPVWYSGLAAIGIIFMSPQILRFDVHFALSHTWFFPALLFLLCRYEERSSRRYQSLHIGLLVFIGAQFHFYFFGMAALFLGFYTVYQIVQDPRAINITRRVSHLIMMIILPFVLLNVWLHWADFVHDRPANPYGFTNYIGRWEGVFLPYEDFPLYKFIDENFIHIRRIDFEAKSYIGLTALIFSIWLISLWVKKYRLSVLKFFGKKELVVSPETPRLFPKQWNAMAYHRVHRLYLYSILLGSVLLLLFSLGFPFAIPGFEWMIDFFGPIRQFRGLGRFTWAFYYVINTVLFYWLWNTASHFTGIKGGKYFWLKYVIIWVPLAMLLWDASWLQQHRKPYVGSNEALKSVAAPKPDHWINAVDFNKFQALLPLPYYHAGSENIWLDMLAPLFQRTQTTAIHTGIPDMGVNMSRTSLNQTVRSNQLVLHPTEIPRILDDLPDNRPIAVMILPDHWDAVRLKYPHLTDKATPVFENTRMKILSLAPDSIRAWLRQHVNGIKNEINTGQLTTQQGWLTDQPSQSFVYQSFDSIPIAARVFRGTGAFTGSMCDTTWLFNGKLKGKSNVVSFWIYVNEDLAPWQEIHIEGNGQKIDKPMREILVSILDGWALVEVPFEAQPDETVRIYLRHSSIKRSFTMDELLIRPASQNLWRRDDKTIGKNNRWYSAN